MLFANMDVVNLVIDSYIAVYGLEKWNSLTEQQQHDVIILITKTAVTALEKLEKRSN